MNSKTTPKDFFLHLGAIISLYLSTVALISLGCAIIDKIFPDALNNFVTAGSIVLPVSILIIMVPALYVIEWFIFRDTEKIAAKKDIWVRKWRIYLTLFLMALTMAIDLIVILNIYLNGEVTERFIWKALIVFLVPAVVFAYYLLARIGSATGPVKKWRTALAYAGGVLAVAAIISGFIIVGSPAQQRSLRFDEQRVSDISSLQEEVENYANENEQLPASLSALANSSDNFTVPTDPETGAQYIYQTEGTSTFKLCATFDLPSNADSNNSVGSGWDHSAGNVCFNEDANISSNGVSDLENQ